MKRLLSLVMVLVVAGLFVGCGNDKDRNVNKNKDVPQAPKDADK